ncbi:MAG: EscU/YscU/HrcU family type III secretion system export apparatus switch protein [Actinomycetota bacterium]|nr:EscU/YscU/HrcU family type III secretion system export apparatus switch protein [Actinomycetota bacterium]
MAKGGKRDEKKKAIALGYAADKDSAPKVLARGSGLVADRIMELAKEKGVTLYEDAALVEALSAIDIGKEIPEELYKVVAEVLAFIYALDNHAARAARR